MADQSTEATTPQPSQVQVPSVRTDGSFDEAAAVIVGPLDEVVEAVYAALRLQAVAAGQDVDEDALRAQAKAKVEASHVSTQPKTAPEAAPAPAQVAPPAPKAAPAPVPPPAPQPSVQANPAAAPAPSQNPGSNA